MKKLILFVMVAFASLTALSQSSSIFTVNGLAIKGYDVVAFFKDSAAVKGYDSLRFTWKDAVWLFSSTQNLEAFKKAPEQYEPQYGGYCAYGVSDGEGHKAPVEIDTWTLLNGRLYFNYNSKVKEYWKKSQQERILKADANWPKLKEKG